MSKKKDKSHPGELLVCTHSKAFKRYTVEDKLEAGMVLKGSEVKSLRAKMADLEGSYASIDREELWLHKMYIAPYLQAGPFGHESRARRKLLIKGNELKRLVGKLSVRGYTLVPLRCYFKGGWAKVELGLAKSKDVGDDRHKLREKAERREAQAAMGRSRGRR